jgi:DNA-binding transcriptional LysR family regulator
VAGGHFTGEQLEFRQICNDEIVLVAPKDHRWAGNGPIRVDELLTEPFVVREKGSGTGQSSASALRSAGIMSESLRKTAILGSNHAVTRAVIAGAGVSFVSALSVRDELLHGSLIRVMVEGVTITRQFFLVKRKGRELSPAAGAFADVMLELYGDGSPETWEKKIPSITP